MVEDKGEARRGEARRGGGGGGGGGGSKGECRWAWGVVEDARESGQACMYWVVGVCTTEEV